MQSQSSSISGSVPSASSGLPVKSFTYSDESQGGGSGSQSSGNQCNPGRREQNSGLIQVMGHYELDQHRRELGVIFESELEQQ